MPLSYKIDYENRYVTVQTSGLVTFRDAVKTFRSTARAIQRRSGEKEA
ncbi:MAG: hypothetical protein WCP68_15115 [Enhydrobacter sp.]